MRNAIESIPFLRITTAFIVGIVCGWYSLLSLMLLIPKWGRELWIYIVILITAAATTSLNKSSVTPPLNQRLTATMIVGDSVSDKYRAELLVIDGSRIINTPILLELNTPKAHLINKGDTIKTAIYIESATKYAISNKSLLAGFIREGGKGVAYTYPDEVIYIARSSGSNNIIGSAERVREKLALKLEKISPNSDNVALLKAMILGMRDSLPPKISTLYKKAGITHTLAISGLHIGVLFLILNLLLIVMNTIFYARIAKIIIIIITMALYAVMVGLTPSVVRAVIMFSAMQLTSMIVTSRYHIYNILFFAAFVMLAYKPTTLYNVSFQLSFVAMLSVIVFGELTKGVFNNRGRIERWLYTTATMTLLISTAMLPLSLYHFGSGSLLPILSNLTVTLLITPLFLVTIVYLITPISFLGEVADSILAIIHKSAELTAALPNSYVSMVTFDRLDLILSYTAIVMLVIYFSELKKRKEALRIRNTQ